MSKNHKKPKTASAPTPSKSPKVVQQPKPSKVPKADFFEDAMKMTPCWRVSLVQLAHPWGWHELDGDNFRELHGRLAEFESKTWKQILVDESYRNHEVEQWQVCKDAQDRLKEMQLDDVERLLSLRIGARERIWGIRDHNVLHLLWWDPEHLVYPVEKRNT